MKNLTMAAFAAVLMATTPIVAAHAYPDAETQDSVDWQNLVAKVNHDRLQTQTETGALQNQGDVASVRSNQATDAVQASATNATANAGYFTGGKYKNFGDLFEDR